MSKNPKSSAMESGKRKAKSKNLGIAKETIQNLSDDELDGIKGGAARTGTVCQTKTPTQWTSGICVQAKAGIVKRTRIDVL